MTNQKSVIDMPTKKKKESKHNGKDSYKLTREENKRRRWGGDLKKQTPNNKIAIRNILIITLNVNRLNA